MMIAMLIVDQLVKGWVRQAIPVAHASWNGGKPFPGFFEITLTYNQGIAFGLFKGMAKLMTPIAVAIAGGAGWYSWRHPDETSTAHVAMGLLAAGALGNLYDRLFDAQGVTDMFWFRAIDFPVFNIADACITVATILLIFTWWADALKHRAKTVPEPIVGETPLAADE
ncbi:Lipoprotein signal peptidase [Fimbriimonas ginsengisoli Gsoil 348]|uniref:Lipoprotein signal peptidase n=1 Tax=Fimbriimonas ginsengisoli Gsoil 348 TaxID=661478 RepID=A0A068NPG2_FIMGI|nr:Lipoprotein signal peptidase [Fimbriimonas ginsengisoli Gsoil 348]